MTYMETISRTFKVLGFNETAATEVANDEKATGHGFLTLALIGIITGLISAIYISFISPVLGAGFSIISIFVAPILWIIGFIIGYSIYHFFAKIFGGQATGTQYFRVMSNVMLIYLIVAIPIIGTFISIILWIYLIALNTFVLNKIHKISMIKSVIVALLPVLIIAGIGLATGISLFTSIM